MEISGPINIAILDRETTSVREMHISFVDEFRSLNVEQRSQAFASYLQDLHQSLQTLKEGSEEYQGVMLVLQFGQEVFPYIQSDEIPLNETIVAAIQQNVSISSLGNYQLKIDG